MHEWQKRRDTIKDITDQNFDKEVLESKVMKKLLSFQDRTSLKSALNSVTAE